MPGPTTGTPKPASRTAAGVRQPAGHGRAHYRLNGVQLSSQQWAQLRARWQQRLPQPCPRCGETVQPWDTWNLDHVGVPVVLGATDADVRPAHARCDQQAGGQLAGALAKAGAAALRGEDVGAVFSQRHSLPGTSAELDPSPEAPGASADSIDAEPPVVTLTPGDSAWDRCGWLDQVRDVPPTATWPRLMTPPHPAAVGSYGTELLELAESRGQLMRWWQRLALLRLLEHDDDGLLVWTDSLTTTARQVGKSVTLRELCWDRLNSAGRFGEEQLILHTSKDLPSGREVIRPARTMALGLYGFDVKVANGQEAITAPDGSRWLLRGTGSVYSYAATLAVADECWAIPPSVIEEGLEPTLADRVNTHLAMFSTAHRAATSLIPLRRAGLLETWSHREAAGSQLLLEWSGPRQLGIEDRDGWRLASPHWTPGRERLLEAKLARVQSGHSADPDEDDPVESFRSQFLNVWPLRRLVTSAATEQLLDRETWEQLGDLYAAAPEQLSVAVEDWLGLGAAAAAAGVLPDGRVLVWGDTFASRADAAAWAAFTIGRRPAARVLVGASIPWPEVELAMTGCDVSLSRVGSTDTTRALPSLRALARAGRLAHDGSPELEHQVTVTRVQPSTSGGLAIAHKGPRSDLLRAAAWAVADVDVPADAPPLPFFVY